jgi:YYY domain-containing protein
MEWGPVVAWLAAYLLLYAAGLPLAAALAPRLADRGAGVALPLALGVVGLVAYWAGRLSFGPLAGLAGVLALAVLAAAAASTLDRAELDPELYAETGLVFALAFLFMIAVRALDPAVHPGGGEKFLDFGLVQSLLRAPALPPEDMWFAGESVRYYYGGHMLTALLAELTLTPARYAYNLGLAGFYAMLVTAAYGLAGSLGEAAGARRTTAAALGAFLVGVASNLYTPLRALLSVAPEPLARPVAGIIASYGDRTTGEVLTAAGSFSYWTASRVIPGTINEFPLFAWLNGDLHAHMMSTPFLLLAATLAFSYYRTPERELRRRWLLLGTNGLLAGLVAVINTWPFPTVFGVTALAVAFGPADPLTLFGRTPVDPETEGPLARELRWTGGALAAVLGPAAVGLAASLPFWLGAASGRAVGLLPDRSPLWGLLVVHGVFLAVFGAFLLGRAADRLDRRRLASLVAVLTVAGGVSVAAGAAALAVVAPIAVGAWLLLRVDDRAGFPAVLVLAGAGLVLLVEFVYVREQAAPGRFNTVFKTYMQVWVLWGPAAGAILAGLATGARPSTTETPFASADRAVFGGVSVSAGAVLAALLVASTSLYGGLAMASHASAYQEGRSCVFPGEPTLDATAFVEECHPEEAAAIDWLDRRAGRPVVAAAPGRATYRWANPVSSLTGLPTVAGWGHEAGYRGAETYAQRADATDLIFEGTPRQQVATLSGFDVSYVYVGPAERERYRGSELSFEALAGVTEAHRSGNVTVYAVDQSALAVREGYDPDESRGQDIEQAVTEALRETVCEDNGETDPDRPALCD